MEERKNEKRGKNDSAITEQATLKKTGVIKSFKYKYGTRVEWEIPQYKIKFSYRSPPIQLFGSTWFFRAFPSLTNAYENKSNLVLEKGTMKEYFIKYHMGVTDGVHVSSSSWNKKFLFSKETYFTPTLPVYSSNVQPANDSVIFFFVIYFMTTPALKVSSPTPCCSGKQALSEHLKDLYYGKCFKDITIKVKDREFFALKGILSARSSVFASMFKQDMLEKNGVMEILDCDPDSFDEFLLFLYTGDVSIVSSMNARGLYETAIKFDVQELKEKCISLIQEYMCPAWFYDVLHLATMYKENALLAATTNYFIDHATFILPTVQWQNFLLENTLLGNELFMKFAEKINAYINV